jgi:hypothetical protein
MQFGIPEGSSIDLPVQKIDQESKDEEMRIAQFLDKPEWKKLKEHFESRITFYQTQLPNGQPIGDVSMEELAKRWAVSNGIIMELQAVLSTYEEIAKSVRT